MKTNNKHDQFQSQFYSNCLEIQPKNQPTKIISKEIKT